MPSLDLCCLKSLVVTLSVTGPHLVLHTAVGFPHFFCGPASSSLLVLLGQGSPVPLLLHYPVPVSMVIDTVDVSHLGQMRGSVSVAGLSIELSVSRIRSMVGAGLGRGARCFIFGLRDGLVYTLKSCLCFSGTTPVFAVSPSGLLLGILNTTGSCLGSLSISIVLSTNHRSRSRDGAGGGNLVPVGVHL